MRDKIRVILTDDHVVMRRGLVSMLNEDSRIEVIGEADNGRELLLLLKKLSPDIILLDIEMPVMNGKAALEQVLRKYPDIKVIILSMHDEATLIHEFMASGAHAYIPKRFDKDLFMETILKVHEVGIFLPQEISAKILHRVQDRSSSVVFQKSIFSPRELEILKELWSGAIEANIAIKLNISKNTVHTHKMSLYSKTGTHSLVELIKYALKHGLID